MMIKFKLFSAFALSLLLSSFSSLAYEIKATCDFCCGTYYDPEFSDYESRSCCCNKESNNCQKERVSRSYVYSSDNYFSPDNKFCAYSRLSNEKDARPTLFIENVSKSKDIFAFENVNILSFAFSKDSKYILLERSEYNNQVGAQNEFIEIFDLVNEKRIFYMPFIKRCYPSGYSYKSYNIDDLVFINFSGDTLNSIEWDFEGNYINVPARIYNVNSVYVSQLGLGVSVKFNDGSIRVYLPKKDFSGLAMLAEFGASIVINS